MGALALTGQTKYRNGFEPMLEGARFVPRNDVDALRAAMDDTVCGIIVEPIQGEGGIQPSSPEFLQACREAADQHNAALIFDEIQCGMGRTGKLFAFEHFGVKPDVVCIAKPMAAGFPMGAFLANDKFAQHITPGKHGTTFGGGPLACRIALEYLAIIEEENLLEQVRRVGAYFTSKLQELVAKFKIATEARGVGAIQALQLNIPGEPVLHGALADGLLINVTQENVLRFLPPFLLQEKHVDAGDAHPEASARGRAESGEVQTGRRDGLNQLPCLLRQGRSRRLLLSLLLYERLQALRHGDDQIGVDRLGDLRDLADLVRQLFLQLFDLIRAGCKQDCGHQVRIFCSAGG